MAKTGEKKARTKYDVSPETFCTTWETSENAQEVATKLGMPILICHARASGYRAAGVPLKSMPRSVKRGVDTKKLADLVHRLKAEQRVVNEPATGSVSYQVKQLLFAR